MVCMTLCRRWRSVEEEYREPVRVPVPVPVDVDDYIFRSQQEWWVSDR